jgi:hypothetical protein
VSVAPQLPARLRLRLPAGLRRMPAAKANARRVGQRDCYNLEAMTFDEACRALEDRYGSIIVRTGADGAKIVEIAGVFLNADEAAELASQPITLREILERHGKRDRV